MLQIVECDGNSKKGMLTDDHMHLFNKILLENNIDIQMQPTLYSQRLDLIQINHQKFIQIIHSGLRNLGHWVCVYHNDNVIHFYDSLGNKLAKEHKLFLSRVFPDLKELMVTEEVCQLQKKTFNCGLFAIANVIALNSGICPCRIKFKESEMRQHLIKIFTERKISMFPFEIFGDENFAPSTVASNHPIEVHKTEITLRPVRMDKCIEEYERWLENFHEKVSESSHPIVDLVEVR